MNDAEARERPHGRPIGSWTDKPPAKPDRRSDLLTNGRAPGWRELLQDLREEWLVTAIFGLCGAWILALCVSYFLLAVGYYAVTPTPCEQYADTEVAHLPARCAAFYGVTSTGGQR